MEEVQEALARIARLEPRPGRAFLADNDQYVLPEVFVQKAGDDFVVTTNNEHIPHLRISNIYKDLMAQGEQRSGGERITSVKKSAPGNFSSRACINGSRRS